MIHLCVMAESCNWQLSGEYAAKMSVSLVLNQSIQSIFIATFFFGLKAFHFIREPGNQWICMFQPSTPFESQKWRM